MNQQIKDQIGCGYCINEQNCYIHSRFINYAKLGCPCYTHHTNTVHIGETYNDETVLKFKKDDTKS